MSNEYLILATGCMAFEFGRYGLLDGQRVFHLGSCINNSRIAETLLQISRHLRGTLSDMPFLISAPAPICEKAMSIVMFFAALGLSIHSGFPYLITGAPDIADFFCATLSGMSGSRCYFEDNPGVFMSKVRSDFK
jgi:carbon-monoxide dehydrogenase catalytic subunit